MSKLTKHADGSMSYDSGNGKKESIPNEHYCIKGDKIEQIGTDVEKIEGRMYGKGGLIEVVALMDSKLDDIRNDQKKLAAEIKERQNSISGWIKAAISTFVLLVGIGVVMFIKIEQFPYKYVKRDTLNMWADEIRESTKILQKMALDLSIGRLDSLSFYRKQVEILQKNETLYNDMRTTRGSNDIILPKTKLPGGIDPDKLYNELMKQKAAGTDTGTYQERVNRIDKNLLK